MKFSFLIMVLIASVQFLHAQKVINDCSITYTVTATPKNNTVDSTLVETYNGTLINLFIKGAFSKMETTVGANKIAFIYDSKNQTGVRLKETGNNKFLERFTKEKIAAENKKFENAVFTAGTATKEIAGYSCKEGTVKLANGTSIKVFYTTDIVPQNKKFDFQFELVPGFVLEYTKETADLIITNTATKCNLTPVPQKQFEIPTAGYRELK
jgi:GLPGLI family protein